MVADDVELLEDLEESRIGDDSHGIKLLQCGINVLRIYTSP